MVEVPKLVFIIPYRDRKTHYDFFLRHMKYILEDMKSEEYKILFIEQNDTRPFNRGAMKNIGFLFVKEQYPNDYENITLVFNDIDTLPFYKDQFDFITTSGVIKHFYGFTYTLGGILSITAKDFESINGFPNFWAWGYEDNELEKRAKVRKLTIDRSNFYKILSTEMIHFHHGVLRDVNKEEVQRYRMKTSEGFNTIENLHYTYNEKEHLVKVTDFKTRYYPKVQNIKHDLVKNGVKPFEKNRAAMKMTFN